MVVQYGYFHDFCRDSGSKWATIPVCNLFNESPSRGGSGYSGCDLTGIHINNSQNLANLGSILLDGFAIVIMLLLIWLSDKKRAAVGRREMQLFLFGFLIISICEIFTIGGFPLNGAVRRGFSAVHIATVVATAWILLLNAVVGFQMMEDGTPLSMGLILLSSLALFVGTGYIALDTGFTWTNYWKSTLDGKNQAYALYTLYLLLPLLFIVLFFVLEAGLVLGVLGERRPLIYLVLAGLLFALGQIFQFVVSVHICNGTNGKINGGLFETLFTLLSVIMIWVFWSSITEDDWPVTAPDYENGRWIGKVVPIYFRFSEWLSPEGRRLNDGEGDRGDEWIVNKWEKWSSIATWEKSFKERKERVVTMTAAVMAKPLGKTRKRTNATRHASAESSTKKIQVWMGKVGAKFSGSSAVRKTTLPVTAQRVPTQNKSIKLDNLQSKSEDSEGVPALTDAATQTTRTSFSDDRRYSGYNPFHNFRFSSSTFGQRNSQATVHSTYESAASVRNAAGGINTTDSERAIQSLLRTQSMPDQMSMEQARDLYYRRIMRQERVEVPERPASAPSLRSREGSAMSLDESRDAQIGRAL